MSKSGGIISDARSRNELTQTELVEKAKIDNQTVISRWENGKQLPSDKIARKIIKALGLDEEKIIRLLERDRFERDLPQLQEKYGDVRKILHSGKEKSQKIISSSSAQTYHAPLEDSAMKEIDKLPRELKLIFLKHQERLVEIYKQIAELLEEMNNDA